MIRNVKAITASSYTAMLFLGVGSALVGAAARNIGLSPAEIGLMLAIQNVGFGVAVWLTGALADTSSKPRLLVIGSLLLAFAFLTFYARPGFSLNLAIMFLFGAGMGVYEGVTDAMLFDLHEARASLHININHFFVTFGSALITFYLIFLEMNWRSAAVQAGVVVVGLAVFFSLVRLKRSLARHGSYRERMRMLAGSRTILLLFLASIAAVGVDVAAMGIMTTFLVQLRGFSQLTSKLCLVIYLVGIASGRVLIGMLANFERIPRYVVGLLGLGVVSFTVLFFVNLGTLTYVVAFVAGLSLSAVLPLILAHAGKTFSNMAGTVMGTIKVAFPIGGIAVPLLLSWVATARSFQASLLILPLGLLVALVLVLPLVVTRPARRALPEME
jgi:fucose permease